MDEAELRIRAIEAGEGEVRDEKSGCKGWGCDPEGADCRHQHEGAEVNVLAAKAWKEDASDVFSGQGCSKCRRQIRPC